MSLLLTRAAIRSRLRTEAQRRGNAGAYADPALNEAIQIATDQVWYELTRGDEGYGEVTSTTTIVAAAPGAGEALAGDTLDLPANFLAMRSLARLISGRVVVPDFYSRREFDQTRLDLLTSTVPGETRFLIEGPAYDDAGAEIPQRIRFVPPLEAGEVVRLGYITRGPQWTDDVQTFDIIAEAVLGALVSYARVIATTRDDNTDYSKAQQQLSQSIQRFLTDNKRRNRMGVDNPDRYRSGSGWTGYR